MKVHDSLYITQYLVLLIFCLNVLSHLRSYELEGYLQIMFNYYLSKRSYKLGSGNCTSEINTVNLSAYKKGIYYNVYVIFIMWHVSNYQNRSLLTTTSNDSHAFLLRVSFPPAIYLTYSRTYHRYVTMNDHGI